jgi:hypothetical protein
MANSVSFGSVEKEQLVRFGYSLIAAEMANVDAAIRENELGGRSTLIGGLRAASAEAGRVPDGNDRSFKENLNVEFGHPVNFRCGLFS